LETIQLGNTDIVASRIGLGTWAIGGWMWGGSDEQQAIATIQAAIDRGTASAGISRLSSPRRAVCACAGRAPGAAAFHREINRHTAVGYATIQPGARHRAAHVGVAQPMASAVADRWGPHPVLISGALLFAVLLHRSCSRNPDAAR
jgi:hypothetical protein